ncbi:DUF6176 family protein [Halostella litorea]|uniref:DUF6176 family protein n=1 Tax=Halostella litorea TaxID=2528831 RepID=UPI001091C43F|nr:DUF6176 family protein [Halostella litorea]
MPDAFLVKQRIEPGKTERAKEVFRSVGEIKSSDAAQNVLKKEGVHTESAFLQRTDDGEYVLYYIEAEDGGEVYDVYQEVMADPGGEAEGLEEFLEEFQDVVAGDPFVADVEFLYHVTTPDRP